MTMMVASGSACATSAAPEADAGRGVAAHRLADHLLASGTIPFSCSTASATVLATCDDPRPLGRHLRRDAVDRSLEEGAVAAEGEELLRPRLPAARPEPRAAAAGHDHRVKHGPLSNSVNRQVGRALSR